MTSKNELVKREKPRLNRRRRRGKTEILCEHLPKSVNHRSFIIFSTVQWADKEHQYDIIKWIKMLSEKRFAHRMSASSRRTQHMARECSAETLRWIRWVHICGLIPFCWFNILRHHHSSFLQKKKHLFIRQTWSAILAFFYKT